MRTTHLRTTWTSQLISNNITIKVLIKVTKKEKKTIKFLLKTLVKEIHTYRKIILK